MYNPKYMKNPSLSIVIPVYNEERSLEYVLSDTLKNLPNIVRTFEIIVVNDGSIDKTREIAESFSKKSRRVRVINKHHGGFSKALLSGVKVANKEYVCYMQGDGQDLVRDMVNCFKIMQNYDLVLGVRGKRIDYDFSRLVLSYGALILYRLLFRVNYEDVHWVYIWKTKEIQKLKLNPNAGMFTLVESLIKFRRKGLSIGEAESPYRPRYAGASKNVGFDVVKQTLNGIYDLWWKNVNGKV